MNIFSLILKAHESHKMAAKVYVFFIYFVLKYFMLNWFLSSFIEGCIFIVLTVFKYLIFALFSLLSHISVLLIMFGLLFLFIMLFILFDFFIFLHFQFPYLLQRPFGSQCRTVWSSAGPFSLHALSIYFNIFNYV